MYWSRSEKYISFLLFCITFCPSKHAKTLMKILIWICIFQQCGIAYSTRYIRNISNAEHKAWSEWSHLSKQISLISSESLALCVLMFMCPNVRWLLLYVWYHKKFKNTRSYAALWAADLEWIVGPGYSLGGYILEKNHEKTNLELWKTMKNQPGTMKNHEKP